MNGLALGLIGGIALGWWLGRRAAVPSGETPSRAAAPSGVGPHLLPDPALGWLKRMHGALGVWITEIDPTDEGPRAERMIDAERLPVADVVAIDRRLERVRDGEERGAEVMAAGTLVFHGAEGAAVGLLLPPGAAAETVAAAGEDLAQLIIGVRRRPQIVSAAQMQTREANVESVASIALRLAYQLERVAQTEAVVALAEPAGVRIVGVSGKADRRLLEAIAPAGCLLARVARGEVGRQTLDGDPLDSLVQDRRRRPARVMLLPMIAEGKAIGAVALWLPDGGELPLTGMAEVSEAMRNAAPRLALAVARETERQVTAVDLPTGLLNRRGLEAAVESGAERGGALIRADLDQYAALVEHGDGAADAALGHFARIIRDHIRAGDCAGRLEEGCFAIWLPGATMEVGARIAERIRLRVGTSGWEWEGRSRALSATLGVAAFPGSAARASDLIPQAEAALHVAARSGRNRVEVAGGRTDG